MNRTGSAHAFLIAVSVAIISCAGEIMAQGVTYYRVRPFTIGARVLAFSEAAVADNYDLNCMYSNPAALAFMRVPTIVANHIVERSSNVMKENAAIPLFMRKGETVAIGLTLNHVGHIESSPLADFKVMQYGYDVAYARELLPTFSVGGGLGVRYASTESSNLWGVFSTIGIFYTPSEEINYGVSFGGLGSGIRYTYDGTTTTLASENIPRTLRVGATVRYPGLFRQDIVVVSIENEKIFGEDGLRYKGGFEVFPVQYVGLRMGYFVDSDIQVPTFGLGLRAGRWHLDYAMQPSRLTNRFYQVSVAYSLIDHPERIVRGR